MLYLFSIFYVNICIYIFIYNNIKIYKHRTTIQHTKSNNAYQVI